MYRSARTLRACRGQRRTLGSAARIARNTAAMALLAWFALPGPNDARAQQVTYPALGNIDLAEGTIEMWIVPRFDPDTLLGGGDSPPNWRRSLMWIEQESDAPNYVTLRWWAERSDGSAITGPYMTGRLNGDRYLPYTRFWYRVQDDEHANWAEGVPQHVAVCWNGDQMWWIINGRKTEPMTQRKAFTATIRPNEELQIVLGDRGTRDFVIRDLRISSVTRKPEEVGYHAPEGLEPDAWTLLLDPLDELCRDEGEGEGLHTVPRVMTRSHEQTGGRVLDGEGELIETPMGKGLGL